MKKLSPKDLKELSEKTLNHYNETAPSFWEGTKDHDVSQNYQTFLSALEKSFGKGKSLSILDFGCGPGRDLLYFKKLGHHPTGLEGSPVFAEMAQNFSHCPVLLQNFLNLNLASNTFHGIFANASLFHVPRQELPRVLNNLFSALIPKGILFSSNPRGDVEGWIGNRYGTYMELDLYKKYLEGSGFKILHHYYRPKGNPFEEQPWLAVVSKKI